MNVLIACEYSGIVRHAFSALGHNCWSVDLLPSESPGQHVVGDALEIAYSKKWDLIIGHPPCTYLCKAQIWRVQRCHLRAALQSQALTFFKKLYLSPAHSVALENPIGALTKLFRPPDQIIYPYNFGDPYRKDIALWFKNVPPLLPTIISAGRKSVSNHVNSRMSQAQKSKIKSRFFVGVAQAMAEQWGTYNYGNGQY